MADKSTPVAKAVTKAVAKASTGVQIKSSIVPAVTKPAVNAVKPTVTTSTTTTTTTASKPEVAAKSATVVVVAKPIAAAKSATVTKPAVVAKSATVDKPTPATTAKSTTVAKPVAKPVATVAKPAAAAAAAVTKPVAGVKPTAGEAASSIQPVATEVVKPKAAKSLEEIDEDRATFAFKLGIQNHHFPQFGTVVGAELTTGDDHVINKFSRLVTVFYRTADDDIISANWETSKKPLPLQTIVAGEEPDIYERMPFCTFVPARNTAPVELDQPAKIGGTKPKLVIASGPISRGTLILPRSNNPEREHGAGQASLGYLVLAPLNKVPFMWEGSLDSAASISHTQFQQIQSNMIGTTVVISYGGMQHSYITTQDDQLLQLTDTAVSNLAEMWGAAPTCLFEADWAEAARHNFRSKDGLSLLPDGALFHEFELTKQLKPFLAEKKLRIELLKRTADANDEFIDPNSLRLNTAFNFFTDIPSMDEIDARRDELDGKKWADKDGIERIMTLKLCQDYTPSLREFVFEQKRKDDPNAKHPSEVKSSKKKATASAAASATASGGGSARKSTAKTKQAAKVIETESIDDGADEDMAKKAAADETEDDNAAMKTDDDDNNDDAANQTTPSKKKKKKNVVVVVVDKKTKKSNSKSTSSSSTADTTTDATPDPSPIRKAGRPKKGDAPKSDLTDEERKKRASAHAATSRKRKKEAEARSKDATDDDDDGRVEKRTVRARMGDVGMVLPANIDMVALPAICRAFFDSAFDALKSALQQQHALASHSVEEKKVVTRKRTPSQNKRSRSKKPVANAAAESVSDDAAEKASGSAEEVTMATSLSSDDVEPKSSPRVSGSSVNAESKRNDDDDDDDDDVNAEAKATDPPMDEDNNEEDAEEEDVDGEEREDADETEEADVAPTAAATDDKLTADNQKSEETEDEVDATSDADEPSKDVAEEGMEEDDEHKDENKENVDPAGDDSAAPMDQTDDA